MKDLRPGAGRALFFSTTAFAVSFAVWGLVAALAPTFAQAYGLSAKSKSLMIAIPVLLGSIGRLPAGMLADRFGGRKIFSALLLLSAIPTIGIGFSSSYAQLLWLGVFIGIAGTSFAIGVSFTSRWFSKDQQGTALGIFGMGNIGQSIAVFGAPVLALWLSSWRPVFYVFAALSLIWGVVFYLFARDAVSPVKPKTVSENLGVLRRSPLAWTLSLFYFLTFGGFVAFSIYLPTLLKDLFKLSAADAGARTAGFVLFATVMRPVGGMLADRWGGARVLVGVFIAVALLGLVLQPRSVWATEQFSNWCQNIFPRRRGQLPDWSEPSVDWEASSRRWYWESFATRRALIRLDSFCWPCRPWHVWQSTILSSCGKHSPFDSQPRLTLLNRVILSRWRPAARVVICLSSWIRLSKDERGRTNRRTPEVASRRAPSCIALASSRSLGRQD